jgi:hypothetical protein
MLRRRVLVVSAVAAGLVASVGLPAYAASNLVQKKTVSGVHGRSGTVQRYADRSGGKVANSVTLTAKDADGAGGKCTEVWADYSTKPHEHFNPGLLVNCSGGTVSVSGGLTNNSPNVSGVGVVVCEVPNTSGSIVRNSSNCRGQLSSVYLHSGQSYSRFKVNADQAPNGVNIWRK